MNSASGFTFPEKMLEELNSGRLVRVDRLPGGKNNVLWSLLFETGTRRVLKDYLRINADSADRQAREWAYLLELQARSIARVPAPIFRCDNLGFSVFTHLKGVKISSLDITNDFIKLAAKHIAEVALINVGSNPFAKGAYFCINGHINDIERVFSFRALSFARGDKQDMPGMDQDVYMANIDTSKRDFTKMIEEFVSLRIATICLLEDLTEEQLTIFGTASGFPVSVRALAAMTAGHAQHHINIIKERYL